MPDQAGARRGPGGAGPGGGVALFRAHGKPEDSRDDLPQVIVGMAVTRDGIPVRVWSWPGNTAGSGLIRQVKADLREWSLSKVIWVAGRGFTSERNRRALMQGGGGYIIGEKLRSGSAEVKAALSRQGRYKTVRDNLQVKEVRLGDDTGRFIICYNPDQAERDAAVRARLTAQLEEAIAGTGALTDAERGRIEGSLAARPGLKRFLRVTPGGLLRLDKAKTAAGENLDGKYLLRCPDPHMTTEDIALGYKQLLEAERGWRDMKQVIDLRPVCHRREDRIRAHVILCWLALLLIRVAENEAGPGTGSAPSSSASTPSPGPAPPAPSARPPTSPSRCGTSTLHSISNRPRRSSPWTRHPQPPDLPEHQRLVTRPVTGLFGVPADHCPFFGH